MRMLELRRVSRSYGQGTGEVHAPAPSPKSLLAPGESR
jgi:hypothetical protein